MLVKRPVDVYCDSQCQHQYAYEQFIVRWKAGEESGAKGEGVSTYIRRYFIEKHGEKCMTCGWAELNKYTGKVPLHMEHKDGNYTNNNEDNLALICPNCHSLTPTWGGRNRGNGRMFRQLKRIESRY